MTIFSDRNAQAQLSKEAGKVAKADLDDLLRRQQAIEEKVKNSGKLQRFSGDIKLMFAMIRDYLK